MEAQQGPSGLPIQDVMECVGGIQWLAETAARNFDLAQRCAQEAQAPANRLTLARELTETNGHAQAQVGLTPAQIAQSRAAAFGQAGHVATTMLIQQAIDLGRKVGMVR